MHQRVNPTLHWNHVGSNIAIFFSKIKHIVCVTPRELDVLWLTLHAVYGSRLVSLFNCIWGLVYGIEQSI